MTKWEIRRASADAKRWQFVSFAGPNGAESRGIVDLVAIRRDHRRVRLPLKAGDLFEVILIQIKGGSAAWPSVDDLRRLRFVATRYGARSTVLASWRRGARPEFFRLAAVSRKRARAWASIGPWELFA